MNIQNIQSPPDYINNFVRNNHEQLLKIYEEGLEENNIGILKMICSESQNKMDVQFSDEDDIINNILQKDSWENLKNTIPENKKLFIVQDLDINSFFLLYI